MSSYAVDKLCRRLVIDAQFREALRTDPRAALDTATPALEEIELAALLAGDVGTLSRAGATSFLLWQLSRFELFGLTIDLYAQRIRDAYAQERAVMRAEGRLR